MFASIITHYRLSLCLLLSAGLMVGCSSSSSSQDSRKCTVGLTNVPEVRGLRLGMSVDDFKAKFPYTSRPYLYGVNPTVTRPNIPEPDRFGVINMPDRTFGVLSEAEVDANPELKDINIRQVLFVDGRLAHFRIAYPDDKTKWTTIAPFVAKISESLGLPLTSWEPKAGAAKSFFSSEYDHDDIDAGGYTNQELYLMCDDLAVVVGFLNGMRYDRSRTPFIQMDDLKAVGTLTKRESAWEAEEKAKKEREEEQKREAFKP